MSEINRSSSILRDVFDDSFTGIHVNEFELFEEIKECYFAHGIKDFFFKSDTFTMNRRWVDDLCNYIVSSDLNKQIKCKQFNAVYQVKACKVGQLYDTLSNPQARRLLKEVS